MEHSSNDTSLWICGHTFKSINMFSIIICVWIWPLAFLLYDYMVQNTVHKLHLFSRYTVTMYPYIPSAGTCTSSPCSERITLLPAYARPSPSHNLGCYLRLSHHSFLCVAWKKLQRYSGYVVRWKKTHFPELWAFCFQLEMYISSWTLPTQMRWQWVKRPKKRSSWQVRVQGHSERNVKKVLVVSKDIFYYLLFHSRFFLSKILLGHLSQHMWEYCWC